MDYSYKTVMAEKKKTKFYLYFTAAAVNIATFCCGISFAWTSPELPRLNGNVDPANNPIPYDISLEEESWISSLVMLGAATSPFVAGFMAELLGRKKSLMLCMLPMIAAFATFAFAGDVVFFCVARFLCGMGIGIVFTVLPIYVGEISQDSNRGALGCLMGVLVTSGNLYTFSVGPYVTVQVFNLINLVAPLVFLILAFFIPESPYYLVSKGLVDSAEKSLKMIRHEKEITGEMTEIRKNIDEARNTKVSIAEIFRSKALIKGLVISLGLMFFQQFSGINCVLSYMQTIFDATGSELSPQVSTIIVGVVQVLACFITYFVVDRWGRRLLLLASNLGSAVSLGLLGLYFYLKTNGTDVTSIYWLPVVSLISFIIMYNIGLGTVPYSMLGELFPPNTKSMASSLTITFCLFLAFCTTKFFPSVSSTLGMANSFWLFAGFCLIGFVYVWVFVPETKGKSLHEIQLLLGRT